MSNLKKHVLPFLRKIRTILRAAAGREVIVRKDVRVPMERFGSAYGGWDVAIAGLSGSTVVYSCGVGEDASFDVALIERFGLEVHAFDPTPRSIAWVKRQEFPNRFVMHEYGIAAHDGTVLFHPPENPAHVSHTILERPSTKDRAVPVPVKRLSTIMHDLGHRRIGILKMDIEGAEYEVIRDLVGSDIRPRQLLVEFHHRFQGMDTGMTKVAIASLRSIGYQLFSISPTNEEFCFILATS